MRNSLRQSKKRGIFRLEILFAQGMGNKQTPPPQPIARISAAEAAWIRFS
jgi:hypothetical protein